MHPHTQISTHVAAPTRICCTLRLLINGDDTTTQGSSTATANTHARTPARPHAASKNTLTQKRKHARLVPASREHVEGDLAADGERQIKVGELGLKRGHHVLAHGVLQVELLVPSNVRPYRNHWTHTTTTTTITTTPPHRVKFWSPPTFVHRTPPTHTTT